MWYTTNTSGDEFVRMRIRCQSHPVRACDVCGMHKPRRFFCSNQRTSNLKFVTGIYFQTFTVRLSPCNFTHIIPLFFRKTYICYVLTATYVAMIKKIFCLWLHTKNLLSLALPSLIFCRLKIFIFPRHDKLFIGKSEPPAKLVGFGRDFFQKLSLHNKKPHCVFLITVRFFDFHQVFQIKNPHQRLRKCLGTARFIKNLMKNCVLEKTYAFAENS